MNAKITAEHLERKAIVYVRQSTASQVHDHPESRRRQYALLETARDLGFVDVELIDDDLGVSGGGFADRQGFQRLLSAVCCGQVGAVLALEASRLARNDRDWSELVQLGAISNVVLIDHDGIYDPRAINDRLLLGLKGIMSEFETATLRQRAFEAVRAKARRGELRLFLPTGFVYGPQGRIELHPDARVRQAVEVVFRKFEELGSIRQALLWFRGENVTLPTTRQMKGASPEIVWAAPTYHRVHEIISNPLYAGAYAFGRTESRTTIVNGRAKRTSGHSKPMEGWEVLIQDHHPGYIEWQQFLRNTTILQENAYMKPATGRKSARGGRSLLSGMLRCRRCGHTLQVSYRGNNSASSSFRCTRKQTQTGTDWCISFSGARAEDLVAKQILQAVESKAVDAAVEASRRADEARRDQRKAIVLELEQARYEARLAARRYERVDPDMRLVAAELEARWNAALERVSELEARVRSFDAQVREKQPVNDRALRALANNLPAVWNDERTDMRLKQRIVRILIREIIVDVDDSTKQLVLVIHWQGGRHTEVRVRKSLSGRTEQCTDEAAIELVRRMAGRWSDHAISSQLNRIGWRTGTGKNWTDARVRALRSRLNLPAFDPNNADQRMLTAREAAQRLGISATYVGILLANGIIPGTQLVPGSIWWIDAKALDSEQVQAALRTLRERRLINRREKNQTLRIPGL